MKSRDWQRWLLEVTISSISYCLQWTDFHFITKHRDVGLLLEQKRICYFSSVFYLLDISRCCWGLFCWCAVCRVWVCRVLSSKKEFNIECGQSTGRPLLHHNNASFRLFIDIFMSLHEYVTRSKLSYDPLPTHISLVTRRSTWALLSLTVQMCDLMWGGWECINNHNDISVGYARRFALCRRRWWRGCWANCVPLGSPA